METEIQAFVAAFPHFMLHGGVTLALLAAGVIIHILLTPMKEIQLIRDGNTAAAIGVGGLIVGLAIPMASNLVYSSTLYEILIWGGVAIVLQMLAFRVADMVLRELPQRIEKDEIGAAIVLVAVKLGLAFVLAAALSAPIPRVI